ncbi:hypothetical protein EVAR_84279_1 [Eumeta japonica]|uniref:Uncharacterized protein n=1 Tax=Eumeta variegata TaxID=151549 RepID=A0A4C1WUK3_EUMVA|nr:hypothetical protein EVAR_84279_1 [Eumeta japonica]
MLVTSDVVDVELGEAVEVDGRGAVRATAEQEVGQVLRQPRVHLRAPELLRSANDHASVVMPQYPMAAGRGPRADAPNARGEAKTPDLNLRVAASDELLVNDPKGGVRKAHTKSEVQPEESGVESFVRTSHQIRFSEGGECERTRPPPTEVVPEYSDSPSCRCHPDEGPKLIWITGRCRLAL